MKAPLIEDRATRAADVAKRQREPADSLVEHDWPWNHARMPGAVRMIWDPNVAALPRASTLLAQLEQKGAPDKIPPGPLQESELAH